jgi:hypothetical protein
VVPSYCKHTNAQLLLRCVSLHPTSTLVLGYFSIAAPAYVLLSCSVVLSESSHRLEVSRLKPTSSLSHPASSHVTMAPTFSTDPYPPPQDHFVEQLRFDEYHAGLHRFLRRRSYCGVDAAWTGKPPSPCKLPVHIRVHKLNVDIPYAEIEAAVMRRNIPLGTTSYITRQTWHYISSVHTS